MKQAANLTLLLPVLLPVQGINSNSLSSIRKCRNSNEWNQSDYVYVYHCDYDSIQFNFKFDFTFMVH